jgi:hypothetical protein
LLPQLEAIVVGLLLDLGISLSSLAKGLLLTEKKYPKQ